MESQHFISGNHDLFGMLYEPTKTSGKAILIVHPFEEEKKSSQRVLVNIAQTLCESGCIVLLFDLSGCGDSCGRMVDVTLENWLKDISVALDFLVSVSGATQVDLIGLRFGAYLVSLYRQISNQTYGKTILIEPVFKPLEYFKKAMRDKLVKEVFTTGFISAKRDDLISILQNGGQIDFNGYKISSEFYNDLIIYQKLYDTNILLNNMVNCSIINLYRNGRVSKYNNDLCHEYPTLKFYSVGILPFWRQVEQVDNSSLLKVLTNIICYD